ncbi:hypothetical protein ACFY04_03500 [Streptomyces sp. NPDC001549]|uniref:hypothetical protein n=1 Tax=Streptomyces sp. NPDC001549 TaxID=3364586 RepID=UPI00368B8CF6
MKNRLVASAAALALGIGLSLAGAQTASAQGSSSDCSFESTHKATAQLTKRMGAGTSYPAFGSVAKGQTVCSYGNATGERYTACGKTSNQWTRVTGFFSPVKLWVASACLKWPA